MTENTLSIDEDFIKDCSSGAQGVVVIDLMKVRAFRYAFTQYGLDAAATAQLTKDDIGKKYLKAMGLSAYLENGSLSLPGVLENSVLHGFESVGGLRAAGALTYTCSTKLGTLNALRHDPYPTSRLLEEQHNAGGEGWVESSEHVLLTSHRLGLGESVATAPCDLAKDIDLIEIGVRLGRKVAALGERYFTNGTEGNTPKGITTEVPEDKIIFTEETTLTYSDVLVAVKTLPIYHNQSQDVSWMMNGEAFFELALNNDSPLITTGKQPTLMGRRVIVNDFLDKGTFIVGDFHASYIIRDTGKVEIGIDSSPIPNSTIDFYTFYDTDGRMLDSSAFRVFKTRS